MPISVSSVIEAWGQPTFRNPVPADRFDTYADAVPGFLLELWKDLGFSGFKNGLYWICDPIKWQSVVDEWTSDLELPFGSDKWTAVTRSAFGEMRLWGERTGMSITMYPCVGQIMPTDNSDEMSNDFEKDLQIYVSFIADARGGMDLEGEDDRGLFKRVLKRLGPVDSETMYGFVPVPALGGTMMPENIEILDAEVHMHLLSQVTPRTLLVNNPYL
ncbi:GAD-like domain-containing protein [Nocardia sp. CNY236]|uniref:GAD-like domain-containing protein n=1 Tax=Nocardia sp. CNY236 TaxID=1169152 RepID=UPI00048FF94A|nr:GAD-like domain-containing protein [Nocardia sp. CNY236]